jgi:hypothetical protein
VAPRLQPGFAIEQVAHAEAPPGPAFLPLNRRAVPVCVVDRLRQVIRDEVFLNGEMEETVILAVGDEQGVLAAQRLDDARYVLGFLLCAKIIQLPSIEEVSRPEFPRDFAQDSFLLLHDRRPIDRTRSALALVFFGTE